MKPRATRRCPRIVTHWRELTVTSVSSRAKLTLRREEFIGKERAFHFGPSYLSVAHRNRCRAPMGYGR